MATLNEYYRKDFINTFLQNYIFESTREERTRINVTVSMEIYAEALFVVFYIPSGIHSLRDCISMINSCDSILNKFYSTFEMNSGFVSDIKVGRCSSQYSRFSGRVYMYMEDELQATEIDTLRCIAEDKGLSVTKRNKQYAQERMELGTCLAFISHDSRDKESVTVPIAIGLQKHLCPVWYDEFSLTVGDNLRENIEKGI